MTTNRIAELRERLQISQRELMKHLPSDVNPVAMSFIEQGRVLPNVPTMQAISDTLGTPPTEIYQAQDLNLTLSALPLPEEDSTTTVVKGRGGTVEIRCRVKPEEKRNLDAALAALGYSSYAEWWREKYRATLRDFQTLLKLKEGK